MHPTIDFDFFELPVYTALVALGALLGLASAFLFLRHRSRNRFALTLFLDAAIVVFAMGWLGARAYHVALNWNYYSARPEEIVQPGFGGLGMRGAFIAGLIALAVFVRARKIHFLRLADASALGLALGQAMGWIGALVHGANYGVVSESTFALDLPDAYGLIEPRMPLQIFEIALFVILFIALAFYAAQRPPRGKIFFNYLIVTSAANFTFSFMRGDESVFVGTLRVDQVIDAIFFALALVGWAWQNARHNQTTTVLPQRMGG